MPVRLRVTTSLIVVLASACAAGSTPSAALTPDRTASATPSPSMQPSQPSSAEPSAVTDQLATADAACRASTYRDPGSPTVWAALGDLLALVYAHPEGDFLCQYRPEWGDTAVVQGGFEHLADRLTADSPLVRDGNAHWDSVNGTYVWGAVGPNVATVVIELGSADNRIEAEMADGYFVAVIGADVACCLYTAVALDAAGQELARAE